MANGIHDVGFGLRPDRRVDPRSLSNYPVRTLVGAIPPYELPDAAEWLIREPNFDQGRTGTCVGQAGESFLLLPPTRQKKPDVYPNRWDLYRACCLVDEWTQNDAQAKLPDGDPGMDWGTSILALMKVLKHLSFIGEYRWGASVDDISKWIRLQSRGGHKLAPNEMGGPVIIGVPWYRSMFSPGSDGVLRVDFSSPLDGWHAVVLSYASERRGLFKLRNSWGDSWGGRTVKGRRVMTGDAYLPMEAMDKFLPMGADAVMARELRVPALLPELEDLAELGPLV